MSTWRALPGMAIGQMVELHRHRSPWCTAVGHQPVWLVDQIACGRKGCRQAFPLATEAILSEFPSLDGHAFVAAELKRRAA
jgi:predicted NBD/HSP70 family sugar kinase